MTQIDPELIEHGDTRNVTDQYRNWSVEAIKDDMRSSSFPLHIAIENLQHDFNIGSIVRSANAFNVAGVHIVGKRHWNRRGAMSTEKYLELYHHPDVADFISWVEKDGMTVVGIDNIEGSQPLMSFEFPDNAVLVFGQEGPGLSNAMKVHCQQLVAIEQYGSTRSVNVGVAAGIVLYEWVRRRLRS